MTKLLLLVVSTSISVSKGNTKIDNLSLFVCLLGTNCYYFVTSPTVPSADWLVGPLVGLASVCHNFFTLPCSYRSTCVHLECVHIL